MSIMKELRKCGMGLQLQTCQYHQGTLPELCRRRLRETTQQCGLQSAYMPEYNTVGLPFGVQLD